MGGSRTKTPWRALESQQKIIYEQNRTEQSTRKLEKCILRIQLYHRKMVRHFQTFCWLQLLLFLKTNFIFFKGQYNNKNLIFVAFGKHLGRQSRTATKEINSSVKIMLIMQASEEGREGGGGEQECICFGDFRVSVSMFGSKLESAEPRELAFS